MRQRFLNAQNVYWVVSNGRCNACILRLGQQLVQCFSRPSPSQRLSRSAIERGGDGIELVRPVRCKVRALWDVLPEEPVGVLLRAALPRAVRVSEVDGKIVVDAQLGLAGHLGSVASGLKRMAAR